MNPQEFANEEGPHEPVEMEVNPALPPEPGPPTWPTPGQWDILNNFLYSNYNQMEAERNRLQQELIKTQMEAVELKEKLTGLGSRAELINTVFDKFMDIVRMVTATHKITVENKKVLQGLMQENYERISGLKEYLYFELRGLREENLENREEINKVLESLERVEANLNTIREEIVVDDMEGEFPRGSETMPDGEEDVDVEGTEDQVTGQVPDGGRICEVPDNLAEERETGAEQGPDQQPVNLEPPPPPEVAPAQPPPAPIINRRPHVEVVEVVDIADSSSDEDDEDNDADQSDIESECEIESCDCSLSSSASEIESAEASEASEPASEPVSASASEPASEFESEPTSVSDCGCLYATCYQCHVDTDEPSDEDYVPSTPPSSDESEIEKKTKKTKRPTKKAPAKPPAPKPSAPTQVIPDRTSARIAARLSLLTFEERSAKRNAKRASTSTRSLRLFKKSKKN